MFSFFLLPGNFLRTIVLFVVAGLSPVVALAETDKPSHPNIVLIMADDLGWKDVGFNGAKFFETPNLDRLAAGGMVFSDAYADGPVCSPTRAALLTGKTPARLRLTNAVTHKEASEIKRNGGIGKRKGAWPAHFPVKPPLTLQGLPSAEKTIAEYLKDAGYATGFVGKWHLGFDGAPPGEQGFDFTYTGEDSGWCKYFPPYEPVRFPEPVSGEYLTDRLTREAVGFIEHAKEPFLLYLAHYAPHSPIEAKQEDVDYFVGKQRENPTDLNLRYAAMIKALDDSVGQVVDALEKSGELENTVILFWSDNGPVCFTTRYSKEKKGNVATGRVTRAAPLRGQKAWLYEGGIRVPAFIHGGGFPAGKCSEPVATSDLLPTLLGMAGVRPDDPSVVDGTSLLPLAEGRPLGRSALYWHYPHYAWPASAIRQGPYKLIHFHGHGSELYNLDNDLGEKRDLSASMPEKAAALEKQLLEYLHGVGALMPTPNPAYDPALNIPESRPDAETGELFGGQVGE